MIIDMATSSNRRRPHEGRIDVVQGWKASNNMTGARGSLFASDLREIRTGNVCCELLLSKAWGNIA